MIQQLIDIVDCKMKFEVIHFYSSIKWRLVLEFTSSAGSACMRSCLLAKTRIGTLVIFSSSRSWLNSSPSIPKFNKTPYSITHCKGIILLHYLHCSHKKTSKSTPAHIIIQTTMLEVPLLSFKRALSQDLMMLNT